MGLVQSKMQTLEEVCPNSHFKKPWNQTALAFQKAFLFRIQIASPSAKRMPAYYWEPGLNAVNVHYTWSDMH